MRYGQATHIGKVRETNEDGVFSAVIATQFHNTSVTYGNFMVADGMGKAEVGEQVTSLILSLISHHILQELTSPNFEVNNQEEVAQLLIKALKAGNHAIFQKPELCDAGGLVVVTVGIVVENKVILGHVGNTRAYVINSETCQQITNDHVFRESLTSLDDDYFTRRGIEEVRPPIRSVLYRALGPMQELEVDVNSQVLSEGDYLLLCSDGLHRHVKDEEIQRVVMDAPNSQEACDRLITLANERGGEDNISVIVVQV